ncbi:MAG: hypothetical protein GF353_04590 [Candidatus Lokiarchaeota archaeon]|nr:hypothetical protein [Candidatus Lokiarchaeota archaeon]
MKLPKELREKKELIGSGKSKSCSVVDCKATAIRSLSENKYGKYVEKANLTVEENRRNKIFLCKKHYKEVKKLKKSEEKFYQKKGFLDDSHGRSQGKWDAY